MRRPSWYPRLRRALATVGGFARRSASYLRLSLLQAHHDSIFLIASALAYVTILSFIPLLASFSFVGARIFSQYDERSLEFFVRVLPYSEGPIVDKLGEFLAQAESLKGFALLVFFFTAIAVFATVEETMNRVWNVSRRRPLKVRIFSFLMLLFWGPVLIGATFTGLLLLRQSPGLRVLVEESLVLNLLPFAVTLIGLTMLYWLVPYTAVERRNAFAGGLVAALLLEGLRRGFGLYISIFKGVNLVYGSFALVLLFAISIQLTWTIVLLGSELAYTAQYFGALRRGIDRRLQLQAAWVGLAALARVAESRSAGRPALSHDRLAARLEVPAGGLGYMLRPLLEDHLLAETAGSRGGYRLGLDPEELTVERVFEAYDRRACRAVELVGGRLQKRLEEMVERVTRARADCLGELTVADLLPGTPPPTAERAEEEREEVGSRSG